MCSISGMLTTKALPLSGASIGRMLVGGAHRGEFSAGVWTPRGRVRRMGHPKKLVGAREYWGVFPARLALAHTRWPTSGGQTVKDTQPFTEGGVTTTHNGHLFQPAALAKEVGVKWAAGDVDSVLWTRAAARYGAEGLRMVAEAAYGSDAVAALIDGTVYLYRGHGAALCFGVWAGGVMWGSEAEMVRSGLACIDIRAVVYQVPADVVCEVVLGTQPGVVERLKVERDGWAGSDVGLCDDGSGLYDGGRWPIEEEETARRAQHIGEPRPMWAGGKGYIVAEGRRWAKCADGVWREVKAARKRGRRWNRRGGVR